MNVKEFASLGGRARARLLHPKRRSEIAREAARIRWCEHERKPIKSPAICSPKILAHR